MKYYLIAGEASGDLHGSNLMRGLLKSDPAARFRFWGGDRMAEVGGAENRVRDYRETSFFGIVGVLRNLRTISRQLRECREDVLRYAPDVLLSGNFAEIEAWQDEQSWERTRRLRPDLLDDKN